MHQGETDARRHAAGTQGLIGLLLALLIVGSWLALHVYGLFFHRLDAMGLWAAPLLVALQCWLGVGLFIVAHDGMHGSLAPGRPRLERTVGRVALLLYAGFRYDDLLPQHMAHHRAPGTPEDPDFAPASPRSFWRWYRCFLLRYFGWRQFAVLAGVTAGLLALGVAPPNLLAFWALPAILSSLQLFAFGTYLPHRHGPGGFADEHRARSTRLPWVLSLLTCFHFGHHHEHHLMPGLPWWRLPRARVMSPRPR